MNVKCEGTPWLVSAPGAQAQARLRLYCFPYSGGNAVSFIPWQRDIDARIEICAVQLPARGARFREPPCTSFRGLIETLAEVVGQQQVELFAFYGHSLGALLAFELTRHLRDHALPLPQHLIVSGCNAPPLREKSKRLHELPDEELIVRLRDYNGTPAEILENRELMGLLLPAIRADFALGADYHYQSAAPLPIPLSALSGRCDSHVTVADIQRWQGETAAAYQEHWFDGDHFFINTERRAVLDCITGLLLGGENP